MVFEAWHDESESDSDDSDSDAISDGEKEGEEERRKGRRYCGILSVPHDFEAPDLSAAVARLVRSALPAASSSFPPAAESEAEEREGDERGGDFPPSGEKASEERKKTSSVPLSAKRRFPARAFD